MGIVIAVLGLVTLATRLGRPHWASMLSILWVYFGIANVLGVNFTSFQAMVIALTLTGSGYTTEIFRAGLGAVDRGQMEAARSIGLSRVRT